MNTSGIIKVLSRDVASKIAAGEIVDRPASIVKELIENAIDSGAGTITIGCEKSGKSLIKVVDDGEGIQKEDIKKAFLRYATSKIHTIDDLNMLSTYGFRGEALNSISSVAQVNLKSRPKNALIGMEYEVWGGEEKKYAPVSMNVGTVITVRNLFYNVPARRKFLKKDVTELHHILNVVRQQALSHPEITFYVQVDNRTVYQLLSQDLKKRIVDIFGAKYQSNLIEIDEKCSEFILKGYISDPKVSRKYSQDQYLFVNRRSFYHRFLRYTVQSIYEPWINPKEYPLFVLYYDIDTSHIDVNVHPSKQEVKFSHEPIIVELTRTMIRKALNKYHGVPLFSDKDKTDNKEGYSKSSPSFSNFSQSSAYKKPSGIKGSELARIIYKNHQQDIHNIDREKHTTSNHIVYSSTENKSATVNDDLKPLTHQLWQVHKRYIFSQTRSGICIIDCYAARKRIIYERTLKSLKDRVPTTQQLLFPKTIECSATEHAILTKVGDYLHKMGFRFSFMSGYTIMIQGVPTNFILSQRGDNFLSIINSYMQLGNGKNNVLEEKIALSYARTTYLLYNLLLGEKDMEAMIEDLFSCSEPYIDPDGNHTICMLSLDELDYKFRKDVRKTYITE